MESNKKNTQEEAIKKASINIFLLSKEIEDNNNIDKIESKKILEKLNKIDKELLKFFNIKLSNKQKNDAFELMELFKK